MPTPFNIEPLVLMASAGVVIVVFLLAAAAAPPPTLFKGGRQAKVLEEVGLESVVVMLVQSSKTDYTCLLHPPSY